MWLQMPSVGLAELCKIMMEQGYTHASLVSKDTLSAFYKDEMKLDVCFKPEGIYFSPLSRVSSLPEWYEWLESEDLTDRYTSHQIMFIKVGGDSGLISDSDMRFLPDGSFRLPDGRTNWTDVRKSDCCGVRVDNPHNRGLWGPLCLWDVDTIVVWDHDCELIRSSRFFRGLGDYHYDDGKGISMFILLNEILERVSKMI